MNRKINNIINIIIYGAVGFFIASVVHRLLYHNMYPDIFEAQSAPWYLSIELRAIILVFVLLICLVIKVIIKKKSPH